MKLAIVTNAGEVGEKVRRLGETFQDITMDDVEKAARFAVKKAVPWGGGGSYNVPLRAGQVYRRTGTLGAMTIYRRETNAVVIESKASQGRGVYSSYVLGDEDGLGQAWMHQGRWPLLRVEVVNEMVALVETLDADLQAAIDQLK